ncbi:MAG: hypothetical protein ACYDAD_06735 [Acidimicrobiales bacterium]
MAEGWAASGPAAGRRPLGADDVVACPVDQLDFRPYFTNGACPLCGWAPSGAEIARPWTHRADWVWIAFAALLAASLAMTIGVLRA